MEGLEVLKELRELDPLLPVLLLTGRADEDSRVEGLLEGADDYLGKPFSLKELLARIKALLRRAGKEGRRRFGPLELDLEARQAFLEGEPLKLSPTEMNLLLTLVQAPGRVYTREELLGEGLGARLSRLGAGGGRLHPPPAQEAQGRRPGPPVH
jgi:DNA-binding response OmpR family regulator